MKNTLCKITENFNIPEKFKGSTCNNTDLCLYTSFKIGGPAPLFIEPESVSDLCIILDALRAQHIDFFILGGGTNVVIADEGIPVPVISTRRFNEITVSENEEGLVILCGSGTVIENLIQYCIDSELEGLENFAGLPGTIGGAVYMNARCYEKSISEVISRVLYVVENNGLYCECSYAFSSNDWAYKKSPFQYAKKIITQAELRVKKGKKDVIAQKVESFIEDRREKGHFKYPSAGSVFKNNHEFGKPSGKIIDEAGLKGLRIGGVQIAPWHGNFIINVDKGKASEVKELVTLIQKTVQDKFGFFLEPEIIFTQDLF